MNKKTEIVLSVLLVATVAVGGVSFGVFGGKTGRNLQGNIFDDVYYEAYKGFFSLVRNDATRYKLPKPLVDALKPYYKSLKDQNGVVAYAYSQFLKDNSEDGYAITDCYKMYFPETAMTSSIASAKNGANKFLNKNNKRYVRWLLHELAHTEQCYNKDRNGDYTDKRKKFANMWVNEAGLQLFQNMEGKIDEIHDAMPMEEAASQKAKDVLAKLNLQ